MLPDCDGSAPGRDEAPDVLSRAGRARSDRPFFYAVDRADTATLCLVSVFGGVTTLKILPSGSLNHAAFIVPAT